MIGTLIDPTPYQGARCAGTYGGGLRCATVTTRRVGYLFAGGHGARMVPMCADHGEPAITEVGDPSALPRMPLTTPF